VYVNNYPSKFKNLKLNNYAFDTTLKRNYNYKIIELFVKR